MTYSPRMDSSTKNVIPPLLVNRFAKIRMLREATMTYYPTGTTRSPYTEGISIESSIPWVDHPSYSIIPFKKTRDYMNTVISKSSRTYTHEKSQPYATVR